MVKIIKSKNKVALITGGAKGIGAAISERLAHELFNLHIAYFHSDSEFKNLQKRISKFNINLSATKADIRVASECELIVKECIDKQGSISVLILNAGVFVLGSPSNISVDDWKNLVETNLLSVGYLLKYSLPHMRKKGGSIIFIGTGSIADSIPIVEYPMYAASKAGLYVLMRSLAVSEGQYGIRVNMVSPGIVDSGNYSKNTVEKYQDAIPLGRLGKAEDVASAVSFLLSDEASYISGTNIDVSGGWVRSSYR